MSKDVKQEALEQAQQAYGLFIWFVKWFSYVMIFMIVLMFINNWFDDEETSYRELNDTVFSVAMIENV